MPFTSTAQAVPQSITQELGRGQKEEAVKNQTGAADCAVISDAFLISQTLWTGGFSVHRLIAPCKETAPKLCLPCGEAADLTWMYVHSFPATRAEKG